MKTLIEGVLTLPYKDFVRLAFKHPETVNATNALGENAMMLCAFWGKLDKFYALQNMGGNLKATTLHGNTCLHYAAQGGRDDFIIVELVKAGLRPDTPNHLGESAVHLAANVRIAHYLALWCLRQDIACRKLRTAKGHTPLRAAEQRKNHELIQYWKNQDPTRTARTPRR